MKKNLKYINYTAGAMLAVMIVFMLRYFLQLPEPLIWALEIIILIVFYINYNRHYVKESIDKTGRNLTLLFMAWLLLGFIRASFYAEGYWMWKSVFYQLLITLFYVVILISTNLGVVQRYYRLYWLFFLPLVAVSFFIDSTPLNLNYVPYSTLMLFFVLVPKRKRILLIAIMVLYFITNFQRNDLIKILVTPVIGLSISYFYKYLPKSSIKFAHFSLLVLPFILLFLAVSGTFNVFKMDEYIKGDYTINEQTDEGIREESLTTDSRTFLYENVFYTLNKYDAWLFGRSPAFGDEGAIAYFENNLTTGLIGRYGNEVGILDILLWYGLVGAFLYFFIYVRASYLVIYKSRNRFAKGVGLYVAFIWTWAFIWEKPLFETFFMIDLVLLGLCFSNEFRSMTDSEVKLWIKNIFEKNKVKKLIPKPI